MMSQKIAYIVNHYPKGSHSFIRREILALERQDFEILRISIRGWDDHLPDPQDAIERRKTKYILKAGAFRVLVSVASWAASEPKRFFSALRLAFRMSKKSNKSIVFHCIYLAEACVVADWLVQSKSTHIHSHFGTNSAEVAMLAGILAQRPFSFTAHGTAETDSPISIGLAEKIRRADFVVAISYFVRSQLYRWVGYEHWSKIHVVRCGLEKEFHDHSNGIATTGDPRRLVCIGRLSAEKGQMLLLAALRDVLDSGEHCELVLVGDGEMRGEIEKQIRALRLEREVLITGWVSSDEVRTEILKSRALILPSFAEGLPVVLMEAMALLRPVLATHISGVPELVTSNETGWLFPPGDITAMSNAIRACLAASDEEIRRMAAKAYSRVTEQHDIDNEARRLRALFSSSAAEKSESIMNPAIHAPRRIHRGQ